MTEHALRAQLDCGCWVTVGRGDYFWHCPEGHGQFRHVIRDKKWRAKCRRCRFRALEETKPWAITAAGIHMRKWPGHKVWVGPLGNQEGKEELVELPSPDLPMLMPDEGIPF